MNKWLKKVLPFFPNASIYKENELIIEPKNNVYFRIDNLNDELDFECKMLEYLVRPSHKGMNKYWRPYFKRGLNSYFRMNWSDEELSKIYTKLGCGIKRELCRKFINSNFDLSLLA